MQRLYRQAHYLGIVDGAKSNWDFLAPHVDEQILDFYHAGEYVTQAAEALLSERPASARKAWLDAHCAMPKHDWNGARHLLAE